MREKDVMEEGNSKYGRHMESIGRKKKCKEIQFQRSLESGREVRKKWKKDVIQCDGGGDGEGGKKEE